MGWNGQEGRLRDRKGLHDLARLIRHAGQEIHAVDLAQGAAVVGQAEDVQLDASAATAYRRRLAEIARLLDKADDAGDAERSRALAEEQDALIDQLRGAFGLHGRPRPLGHPDAERARSAVTQRIHDTLRQLEGLTPELAAHLRRSVRTGRYCVYVPDEPVTWDL